MDPLVFSSELSQIQYQVPCESQGNGLKKNGTAMPK